MDRTVGREPPEPARRRRAGSSIRAVYQSVVEAADEDQVVEVGVASVGPTTPRDGPGWNRRGRRRPGSGTRRRGTGADASSRPTGAGRAGPVAPVRPPRPRAPSASARRTEAADGLRMEPPAVFDAEPSEPIRSPSLACTTTVARSGSASCAILLEQSATSASARRALAKPGPSSSGITGNESLTRWSALTTTAPWAAGNSPSKPRRSPSPTCHQLRKRPAPPRAPRRSCASLQVRLAAHGRARDALGPRDEPRLGLEVRERASSTTLSIPSSPESSAWSRSVRWSRAERRRATGGPSTGRSRAGSRASAPCLERRSVARRRADRPRRADREARVACARPRDARRRRPRSALGRCVRDGGQPDLVRSRGRRLEGYRTYVRFVKSFSRSSRRRRYTPRP